MPRRSTPRPLSSRLRALAPHTRGATAVEYGLIVALIALTAVGGMSALGHPVTGMFASISSNLQSAR
ncbi:MAG: Flp family type IVb pilin [Sphingomonas phyllosphaerae]